MPLPQVNTIYPPLQLYSYIIRFYIGPFQYYIDRHTLVAAIATISSPQDNTPRGSDAYIANSLSANNCLSTYNKIVSREIYYKANKEGAIIGPELNAIRCIIGDEVAAARTTIIAARTITAAAIIAALVAAANIKTAIDTIYKLLDKPILPAYIQAAP